MHTQIHVCIQHLYAVLFSRTVAFPCPVTLSQEEWVPGGVSSTKDFLSWLCSQICSGLHADRAEVDQQKGWGDPGLNSASASPWLETYWVALSLFRMTKTPKGLCWWMCAHLKVPRYLTMAKKEGEVCACIYLFLTGQFVLPAAEGIWLREVLLPSWERLVRSKK